MNNFININLMLICIVYMVQLVVNFVNLFGFTNDTSKKEFLFNLIPVIPVFFQVYNQYKELK